MERSEQLQNESASKGNSEDSLLVIYILQILKKYSSPEIPLSSQDVIDHLRKDYSIGSFDKSESQRKKVRRHLDTLHESYWGGGIKKEKGKTTREGHKWFYDASQDRFADKDVVIQESLTETEVEFLVDLISATKILNHKGTRGLIDKLLKKTSITKEDRERRLGKIEREAWLKTPNEDLVEKKDLIEECFYSSNLTFDYEDEKSITATPLGWSYDNGICFLDTKVEDEYRKFSLDKIRICDSDVDGFEALEDFSPYDKETDSDKTTLDSLFVNIPTITSAITDKKCLRFLYRSYAVASDRVISIDEEKSVLPHSLVFNDGKYYLIGIDVNVPKLNKIAYFRVDLMFELYYAKTKIELSNWDKHVFETIERARVVEKHPLMLVGKDIEITFKVVESALNRVIDTFAVKPDKFSLTKETRMVKDSSEEGFHEEKILSVKIKTTTEEAYRWALANADVVELLSPQEIRDKIARISDPIYQLYTQSVSDKVRENIDLVLREGTFQISSKVDEDTAYKTYKELSQRESLGAVDNVCIVGKNICVIGDYVGDFYNAERLCISTSELKDFSWASRLINLKTIELTQMQTDDTSWMKEMKKLRRVYLIDSPVTDLSVLRDNKDIYYLDISNTNISDISFIEKYQNLTYLNIVGCPIDDYSPLFTTQSQLKCLEIDEKAIETIGEAKLRDRHIGIDIIRNNSYFWSTMI